jgi:hypothetical protein
MGAFSAAPKTGLSRGSVPAHGRRAAMRRDRFAPFQSLAQLRCPPLAATACSQAPQEVSIIPHKVTADFTDYAHHD